jgi:Tfp pilus assembly protein PilF
MNTVPSGAAELEATLQQAVRHHQAGQLAEAERLYRNVLQSRPDHPGVSNALGIALKQQGRVAEAALAFQQAVAAAPDFVPAQSNLGNILFEQGKRVEAEACYRRALALQPDMVDALKNLGLLLVDSGRFPESFPSFRRHAELVYGRPENSGAGGGQVPPHKARHDQEQRDYLGAAAGAFHLEEGGRIGGRAVNPDSSGGDIAMRWQTVSPQIAVIDNLLSDEALDKLRQYCWRSTMWHQIYKQGYVGAMPEHGFACPLLAQIVDELRSTYPVILGQHPLLRWWGFKYDNQLSGINIHADFAAVNVNIWITPDDANLDPNSGGLVIWDKPAPLDWSFDEYNALNSAQAIRDFLERSGAKSVNVPYRSNRAVVFDSDLFHQGDRIAFKDGYLNRRINITMLFGLREKSRA